MSSIMGTLRQKLLVSSIHKDRVRAAVQPFFRKYEEMSVFQMNPDMALDMTVVMMESRCRRGCLLEEIGPACVWCFAGEIKFGDVWCGGLAFYDAHGFYPSLLLHNAKAQHYEVVDEDPAPGDVRKLADCVQLDGDKVELPTADGLVKGYGKDRYPIAAEVWGKLPEDVMMMV